MCAVALNARIGFAKSLGGYEARIYTRLDQGIADGLSSPPRESKVVFLCSDVIGISVYVNGISLERHQDARDAVQDVAVSVFDIRLVKLEPDRFLAQRHHQPKRGAMCFGNLPEHLL